MPRSVLPKLIKRPKVGTLPWPRRAEDGTPLGVDLGRARAPGHPPAAHEVQAIVFAFLEGQRVPFEREDVLQEVLLTIVRRNRFRSAYDPRLATFAKYVWLVSRNVLGHMLQRHGRTEAETLVDELPDVADARDPIGEWEEAQEQESEGEEEGEEGEEPKPLAVAEAPAAPPPAPDAGKVIPFPKKGWEQLSLFERMAA